MKNPSNRSGSRYLFLLTILVLVHVGTGALAKDYFIAPNGDDEDEGTLRSPWASAARFARIADPGDTLFIRGGIYRSQETILTRSGTAEKPITFRNYGDEVPIFDGTDTHYNAKARYPNAFYSDHTNYIHHITFQGLVIRNYFRGGIHLGSNYVPQSHEATNDHITIRHCLVDNCGQNGITISYGDGAIVESCLVSRTGWSQAAGSWSSNINLYNMVGTNNRVCGNVSFHSVDISNLHTDGNGMILDMFEGPPGAGATVENNLLFENGGVGIAWTRCQNAKITNNTLWNNSREPTYIHPGCGIYFWDATAEINLLNNIIWQADAGDAMQSNSAITSGTRTNNLITKQPGAVDPQLIDPAKLDFNPGPDSPAREGGTSAQAPAGALWFDPSIVKTQTSGQPISWYRWAPDIDRIAAKGGLSRCLGILNRPEGKTDIGALARKYTPPGIPDPVLGSSIIAENLVVNGGFEVPAKQWDLATIASVTDVDHYRGNRSLQIAGSGSWSSTWQTIPVKQNTKYKYSAWLKGTCSINLKVATTAWATLVDGVQKPNDAWKKYEVAFDSGSNSEVLISIMEGSEGTTFVDTVTVVAQ